MKYLLIDTCANNLIVAVVADGKVFSACEFDCQRRHSERLCFAVENALSSSGLTFADLDALACCVGTGSFTGVRIGVSTLKGYKTAFPDVKLVSFTSLNALSYASGCCSCYMDAGNGLYFARYDKTTCLQKEKLVAYDERDGGALYDENADYLSAEINLVNDKIAKGEFCDRLSPLYVRLSQAEENLKK